MLSSRKLEVERDGTQTGLLGSTTTVFISYSRKDQAFVQQLHEALRVRGRQPWIDWRDIRLSAEWLKEIFDGIEAADSFLFVISPDSIASEICKRELEHAVRHNKRLVPIMHRAVDSDKLPRAIAEIQWTPFNDADDFETAIQRLLSVIDTDLDWVRTHTRLLIRAIEWEREGNDSSLLLRGGDLRAAEHWLVQAGGTLEPRPTPLQTGFVIASRRAETARRRLILVAVTFGLIVSLCLGIVALWQRNQATYQTEIAVARLLLTQAELIRTQEPHLLQHSIALAVESIRRSPSLEAVETLRRGLALSPQRVRTTPSEQPSGLDVHRDKSDVLAASVDGAFVAKADSHTVWVRRVDNDEIVIEVQHSWVTDGSFSPDGKYLATASSDGEARVWDIVSGHEVTRMTHDKNKHEDNEVTSVAFSPDGLHLATGSRDGTARVWTLPDGREVVRMKPQYHVTDVIFSPNGRLLATLSGIGTVRIWNVAEGRESARTDHSNTVQAMIFSADGAYLASASADRTVHVTGTNGWGDIRLEHEGGVRTVAFSLDGKRLATTSADRTARVWERLTGREVARIGHEDGFSSATFSPDGHFLVTTGSDGTVSHWELAGLRELTRVTHQGRLSAIVFSPDSKSLATASDDGQVRVSDVTSGHEIVRLVHEGGVRQIALDPDWRYLATTSDYDRGRVGGPTIVQEQQRADRRTRIWALPDGREVVRLPDVGVVFAITFPDERHLVTASRDHMVRTWNATNGREVSHAHVTARVPYGLGSSGRFSADGQQLITVETGDVVRLWNCSDGQEAGPLPHGGLVHTAELSRDGRFLATVSLDGITSVWKAADGWELVRQLGDTQIDAIDWSADARFLATATRTLARVWDIGTGQVIGSIPEEGIEGVALSSDGRYLATRKDGVAQIWPLRHEDLITQACRRLTRNLTPDEWRRYLGDKPYRLTCPDLTASDE